MEGRGNFLVKTAVIASPCFRCHESQNNFVDFRNFADQRIPEQLCPTNPIVPAICIPVGMVIYGYGGLVRVVVMRHIFNSGL